MAQLDTHREGALNGGRGADAVETRDWLDALHDVRRLSGNERVRELLRELQIHAQRAGGVLPVTARTPYVNSIPPEREPPYPGDESLEWQIRSIIRWNAMAMVVAANREADGIGGHISTYASAATLYEVGFNHFFRGPDHPEGPDIIYFQGHATPGIYARAYLEGRLTAEQIHDFRRELMPSGGVSSYPHPWLMPDFWQFPTVSMGLGPLMSIYQARFMRYLEDRGLKQPSDQRVWAFVGDGEADAPETIAAISLAGREYLDNLTWVVNCNLQRLDGPVRGNGNIVQELEGLFRGAGWNVIKVLWGRDWDELFANDHDGLLTRRAGQIVDGEYQKYSVAGGAYIRENFYGVDERLLAMVADRSDDELVRMNLGGHDARKVYAAFNAAVGVLESLGASVEEVSVPEFHYSGAMLIAIGGTEAVDVHYERFRDRAGEYHQVIRRRIESARFLPAPLYVRAQRVRRALGIRLAQTFRRVDLLALPSLGVTAVPLGTETIAIRGRTFVEQEVMTRTMHIFNMNGIPAISVPCGFDGKGLPVGLQLAGPLFGDRLVLRAANAYQAATDWHAKSPPLGDGGA